MILILPLLVSLLLYIIRERQISNRILSGIIIYGSLCIILNILLTETININISSEKIILYLITILVIY